LRAAAATAFRPLLCAAARARTSAADGPPAGTARALPVRAVRPYPLIRHSVLRRGPPYALATTA
ncbi:hypothetical protein ACWGJA_21200, partial [Streptomyces sp. NPDC054784]